MAVLSKKSIELSWHSCQENQLPINMRLYFSNLFIDLHVYPYASIIYCLDYRSSIVNFEIEKCQSPSLFFFSKIVLAIVGPLLFPHELQDHLDNFWGPWVAKSIKCPALDLRVGSLSLMLGSMLGMKPP